MTVKQNMVTRRVGQLLVSCQNNETPSDVEWDEFLRILVANRENFATLKLLVVTDGGGPTAAQRKRLEAALAGQSIRVAVVTDSIKVRFIVSSVALLNRHISTFSRAETARAYQYLGLSPTEQQLAAQTAAELEAMIRPDRRSSS